MGKHRRTRRRETNEFSKRSLPFERDFELTPWDAARQLSLFDLFDAPQGTEDMRTWHPEGENRPRLDLYSARPRVVPSPPPRRSRANLRAPEAPAGLSFEVPREVMVCVKRQQRKEVLHAKRKTGRSGQKPPRFDWTSQVSCKRRK